MWFHMNADNGYGCAYSYCKQCNYNKRPFAGKWHSVNCHLQGRDGETTSKNGEGVSKLLLFGVVEEILHIYFN